MSGTDKQRTDGTKAVAIKGTDPLSDNAAPKIIAKGTGDLAERILEIAFAEGVKVRQDKDLTELLDAFDVDSPVPLEALHTVSLILERVYAENQRMAESGDEDLVDPSASGPIKNTTLDGSTGDPIPVEDSQPPAEPEGFS
ncbi:MAG: EscU/YscU/HrcU family type III secretion system export apparatus switch protein [Kordiimonadaceae bacterium]|nr:EscU/YscU/HrcU family type III secretion system export apparatus switch protein [Kordiimonadaceae bacterium]MBO6570075.1 EscU/YscU/HrcU family type III secretion system export apparatus switch protein [Kordiimonadaceae bacterium]MBO6965828.1 EscU/YscU/HrcU family type III secretion system export apparatus switch protein [Kordiimonadaceae bacterium]